MDSWSRLLDGESSATVLGVADALILGLTIAWDIRPAI
jgi:hypothetical protein